MTANHSHPSSPPPEPGLDDAVPNWGVQSVIAALGEDDATAPPSQIRNLVLERARGRPRPAWDAIDPRVLYESRVAAMQRVLDTLTPAEWSSTAAPYAWSVHGLVAHLMVIERYTARQFGVDGPPVTGDPDVGHLDIGAADIADQLRLAPSETVLAWSEATRLIAEHANSGRYDPDAPAPLHGWPFSRSSALVARAFEIWTHTDDICRAIGRARVVPSAAELRTMSSFAVRALPFLFSIAHPGRTMARTRVVLTGDGGGTFDIGPDDGERAALLAADVVDYCRVVARRVAAGDLAGTREGDLGLIEELLVASGGFAV